MKKLLTLLFFVTLSASRASGQLIISDYTTPFSQNFNTLATSGTTNAWTDNSTLTGWYLKPYNDAVPVASIIYIASDGSSTAGGIYSYGTGTADERALGAIGSGTVDSSYIGVRLKNQTTGTIQSLNISFTTEQWRAGGGGTPDSDTLRCEYQIGATVTDLTAGTWTRASNLDAIGPVISGTASALDGNAAANRTAVVTFINVTLSPTEEIMIRWQDKNDLGNDNGVSIDDFTVSANSISVPVELIGFTGKVVNGRTTLNWRTASEKNNAGFDIERSADKTLFTKIGFVAGNGTTTEQKSYSFIDNAPAGNAYYRLKQTDFDGKFEYSSVVEVKAGAPETFALSQNYPNPFNPATVIGYQLAASSQVSLKVYDVLGREVSQVVNAQQSAGRYEVNFNAASLSSGLYFYRLQVTAASGKGFSETRRMLLAK